jgi:hypothetical protein
LPKGTRTKKEAASFLVLDDCPHRDGLPSCTATRSQHRRMLRRRSLASRLSWRVMQKCESPCLRTAYMYQSFILKRLSVANVCSDCLYRLLLVCQSTGTIKTTHGHQGIKVQQARRTQEITVASKCSKQEERKK